MNYKIILITLSAGILIFIGIQIANKEENIQTLNVEKSNKKETEIVLHEKTTSLPEKESLSTINSLESKRLFEEKKEKYPPVKIKYNESEFKIFLKSIYHVKIPESGNWFFASNVLAIDKNILKNSISEILWEDKHFYYISNNSEEFSNSYKSFNPNYSLVTIDENNDIGIVNGYFIITLNQNIDDIKNFETLYNVNVISSYPSDNILVARAKEKSNLLNILNVLKTNPSIKSSRIEVVKYFPELH